MREIKREIKLTVEAPTKLQQSQKELFDRVHLCEGVFELALSTTEI